MRLTTSTPGIALRSRSQQSGFLVIALMVILTIMLIYVTIGLRSLKHLHQDLKLVEQKQVLRLQATTPTAVTNTPAIAP